MKWIKRILLVIALLFTLLIALGLTGYYYSRQDPAVYRRYGFDLQDRARINQQAMDKLIAARNQAVAEIAAERRASVSQAAPASPLTIDISEEELNAIVQHHFQYKLDAYIEHGSILLDGGRIVLAAKVRELNAFASAYFQLDLDAAGRLRLRMTDRYLGRVPLPEALFEKQVAKVRSSLAADAAALRPKARLGSDGRSNSALAELAGIRLLQSMLDNAAAEPVLFVWDEGKWVMLRIERVQVEDRRLRLTVRPMPAPQRSAAASAILK